MKANFKDSRQMHYYVFLELYKEELKGFNEYALRGINFRKDGFGPTFDMENGASEWRFPRIKPEWATPIFEKERLVGAIISDHCFDFKVEFLQWEDILTCHKCKEAKEPLKNFSVITEGHVKKLDTICNNCRGLLV